MGSGVAATKTNVEEEEDLEEERRFRAGRKRSNAMWSRRPPAHHMEQDPSQTEALQELLLKAQENGADQIPGAQSAGAEGMQRMQQPDRELQDPSAMRDVPAGAVQNALQQRREMSELVKANQAKGELAKANALKWRIRHRNEGKRGFWRNLGHVLGAFGDFTLSLVTGSIAVALKAFALLNYGATRITLNSIDKKLETYQAKQALVQQGIGDAEELRQQEAAGKAEEDVPVSADTRRIPQRWEEQTADTGEQEPQMELQAKESGEGDSRVVKSAKADVGHVFVRLRYTRKDRLTGKNKRYRVTFGFYPKIVSDMPEMGLDIYVPGELENDKGHDSDIGKSYSVTNRAVNNVLAAAEKYPQGGYSLISRNCTTFAYEMARTAGVDTSFFKNEKWVMPNGELTGRSVVQTAAFFGITKKRTALINDVQKENWNYENLYQNPELKKRMVDDLLRYDKTSHLKIVEYKGYAPSPTGENMRLTRSGMPVIMENRTAIDSSLKGLDFVSALSLIMHEVVNHNKDIQKKFAKNGNNEGDLDKEVAAASKHLDQIITDSNQVFVVSVQESIPDDLSRGVDSADLADQAMRSGNALKVWKQCIARMQVWLQTEGLYDQELSISGYHMLKKMMTISHAIEERNVKVLKKQEEYEKNQKLDPLTLSAMSALSDKEHIRYGYAQLEKIMRLNGKDMTGVYSNQKDPNGEHLHMDVAENEYSEFDTVERVLTMVKEGGEKDPTLLRDGINTYSKLPGLGADIIFEALKTHGTHVEGVLEKVKKRKAELEVLRAQADDKKLKDNKKQISSTANDYADSLQYYVQKDKLSQKDTDFVFNELSITEGKSEYQKLGQDAVQLGPREMLRDAGDAMRMITLNRVYGGIYSYMGECAGKYAAFLRDGDQEQFRKYLANNEIVLLDQENIELTQEQTEGILSAAAIKKAAELSTGSQPLKQMIISATRGILAANHNPDRTDVTNLILQRLLGRNIALNAENGVAAGKIEGYTQDNISRIGKQVMGLNADAAGSLINIQTSMYRDQLKEMVSGIVKDTMEGESPADIKKLGMQKALGA